MESKVGKLDYFLLKIFFSASKWASFTWPPPSASMTSKGPSENLKKMSLVNPVSPKDAKFFVQFFLS